MTRTTHSQMKQPIPRPTQPDSENQTSTQMRKDLHEQGMMEAFIRRCPELLITSYQLLEDGQGAPDCQIDVAGDAIGVELTNFVREDERKWEAACESYLARAQRRFDKDHHGVALDVQVSWNPHVSLRELYADGSEAALVAFIHANVPLAGTCVFFDWNSLPAPVQELMCEVRVCQLKGSSPGSDWHFGSSCWVPDLTIEAVSKLIERKNTRLPEYRQFFDKVWLLISQHAGGASSIYDISAQVTSHTYETSFDRVYLLGSNGGETCRLLTKPSGPL